MPALTRSTTCWLPSCLLLLLVLRFTWLVDTARVPFYLPAPRLGLRFQPKWMAGTPVTVCFPLIWPDKASDGEANELPSMPQDPSAAMVMAMDDDDDHHRSTVTMSDLVLTRSGLSERSRRKRRKRRYRNRSTVQRSGHGSPDDTFFDVRSRLSPEDSADFLGSEGAVHLVRRGFHNDAVVSDHEAAVSPGPPTMVGAELVEPGQESEEEHQAEDDGWPVDGDVDWGTILLSSNTLTSEGEEVLQVSFEPMSAMRGRGRALYPAQVHSVDSVDRLLRDAIHDGPSEDPQAQTAVRMALECFNYFNSRQTSSDPLASLRDLLVAHFVPVISMEVLVPVSLTLLTFEQSHHLKCKLIVELHHPQHPSHVLIDNRYATARGLSVLLVERCSVLNGFWSAWDWLLGWLRRISSFFGIHFD